MDTITLDPVPSSLIEDSVMEALSSVDRSSATSRLYRSDQRLYPIGRHYIQEPDELTVVLIQAKNYDRDGYINRYWRGVLPSNSLSVMYTLTEAAATSINQRRTIEGKHPITIRPVAFDESVHKIDTRKIIRMGEGNGQSALVGFVGVQTNQYPRAIDLGRQFRKAGLDVMIGGFHISGHPPSREEVKRYQIIPVAGEVDDVWDEILLDAICGDLRTEYHVGGMPDLSKRTTPHLIPGYMDKFFYPFSTIDTSRGCPFNCSFCTVKNIAGRTVRARAPEEIVEQIERQYDELGINFVFFVDDDIARSPVWEPLFDGMIDLREKKGKEINFMMEIDTISYKIPNFVDKAARGGCTNVFVGVESLNQMNIKLAGKSQNKVRDMKHMVDVWHEEGIFVHAGYIIGFAYDTPSSVAQDVELLKESGVDLASFFILMNLPGSDDYAAAVRDGTPMSSDFNIYDSFQVSTPHPNQKEMSNEKWEEAYRAAWRSFYSVSHMVKSLSAASARSYWGLLRDYVWYRLSIAEGQHPMNAGFFRLKDRHHRRPGFPQEGIGIHLRRRAKDLVHLLPNWIDVYDDMKAVWLATRDIQNERVEALNRCYNHSREAVGRYRRSFAKTVDTLFENNFLWHLLKTRTE